MNFEARTIVNGGKLREFNGRVVSLFVQVQDCTGMILQGKTTDANEVRVQLSETISVRDGDWVEVIGVPVGPNAVKAREVIQFYKGEEDFDAEAHNMLVQFINLKNDFYQLS